MAAIAEVAKEIYRINYQIQGSPVTYSFLVIEDDPPALVQTGFGRVLDETTPTFFSSDVFMQLSAGPPTTDQDFTQKMLEAYRMVVIFPSRKHPNAALDKTEPLTPGFSAAIAEV